MTRCDIDTVTGRGADYVGLQVGPTAFEVARHWVDDVVSVSERMIALAVLRLLENERCVR
jgi:threonine dehydratase